MSRLLTFSLMSAYRCAFRNITTENWAQRHRRVSVRFLTNSRNIGYRDFHVYCVTCGVRCKTFEMSQASNSTIIHTILLRVVTRDNKQSHRWIELITRYWHRSGRNKWTTSIGIPIERDIEAREENRKRKSKRNHQCGYYIRRINLFRNYYELSKNEEKCGCMRIFAYLRVKIKFRSTGIMVP